MINLGRGFFGEVSVADYTTRKRTRDREGREKIYTMSDVCDTFANRRANRAASIYALYLARGSGSGRDVDDWLAEEAEKDLSASCFSSPPKVRTVAAGQGRSALVSEADSKRASPAHHDRIDVLREFSSSSQREAATPPDTARLFAVFGSCRCIDIASMNPTMKGESSCRKGLLSSRHWLCLRSCLP